MIRLLALAGANLDLFDKDGVTPLACVVSSRWQHSLKKPLLIDLSTPSF